MPAHDPDGVTRKSQSSNSATTLAARAFASARSPELYAGWPQQVCDGGTKASAPPDSISSIAAKPIDGRIRSTRQVTKKPTRMAGIVQALRGLATGKS